MLAARSALKLLADSLPPGAVEEEPTRDPWGRDASHLAGVSPIAVVHAGSVEDVQNTMKWAFEHGVPVAPRGAGTGKAGGAIPKAEGIVLSLAKMTQIRSVEARHSFAEVEPGVITGPFRAEMEAQGLFYPPDPASLDQCTLGGNVATNAGGPLAVKYGVTGNFVMGLDAVLPDGRLLQTGKRQPKGVAGTDLCSLLVGSEGTLAVMVGLRLRLLPRPRAVATALLPFPSSRAAAAALLSARLSGLLPRAAELLDKTSLDRARLHAPFPLDPAWGALLLVEFDGEPGRPEEDLARFADLASDLGGSIQIASSPSDRAALWETRRQMSVLVKKGTLGHISEDVAVPLGSIPDLLDAIERIGKAHRIITATYGHLGDGNLHVNLLWEEASGAERGPGAADAVFEAALALGGTITGEHGVGLAKKGWLPKEVGPTAISLMAAIKSAWDPRGILNPGKVVDRIG